MPRPIGSKNQKTIQWDAFGNELIQGGLPRLQSILENADDDTFVKIYIPLLEYFKPKLKRVEMAEGSTPVTHRIVVQWDETPPPVSSVS